MKKIRYNRVVLVSIFILLIIIMIFYLYLNRNQYYEYDGDIQTIPCTYRQNSKIYSFDLKIFQLEDDYYISLNDLYNMIVILDKNAHVYIHENKHVMVYELTNKTYYFKYGQDKIIYNNDCIHLKDYHTHIYISHKNVYMNVSLIEKLLLNNEKKIKIKKENAIIE
ncbi:MAG: hypothetical protein HFF36_10010 [Coprobacillus sp.]|nr:hypothetical protein [Coprobacillus sp.]